MAETVTIPSPTVLLNSPVEPSAAKPAAKKPTRRPSNATKKTDAKAQAGNNGVTKQKQSKSRNGMPGIRSRSRACGGSLDINLQIAT